MNLWILEPCVERGGEQFKERKVFGMVLQEKAAAETSSDREKEVPGAIRLRF